MFLLSNAGKDEDNFQPFPDDMDWLELSLSEERALLQTILPESDSPNPSLVATSTSSSIYVQRVLTDRAANTNYGLNMLFKHVKEVCIITITHLMMIQTYVKYYIKHTKLPT